jgi:hypothetical protein
MSNAPARASDRDAVPPHERFHRETLGQADLIHGVR